MAIIHFDQTQRREYKEPQTTKKELLKPPAHTAYVDDWNTLRSASSIANCAADTTSWSFDTLNTTETSSGNTSATMKEEIASPMPGIDHQRRISGLNDTEAPAELEKRDSPLTAGRGVSGASSDDKYGRKSGVIDLTADDSEDEQDMTVPERQFVPRAEDDNNAARFQRRKTPSPPRTFTRGLSPIAAHPRKAPIVHRSKPPIKPRFQRQIAFNSSPAPANQSHSVFSRPHRPLATARHANEIHMAGTRSSSSSVRTLEGTPLGTSTDSMSKTPMQEQAPNSSGLRKATGPFIQEDDSSSEEEAAANKKSNSRTSLARLTKRPRNDTPTRNRPYAPEVDADAMHDASRDIPIPSIEFPSYHPVTDEAMSPPVRTDEHVLTHESHKRNFSVMERRATPAGPPKRQQTLTASYQSTKNGYHHHSAIQTPFEKLLQKGRLENKTHSSNRPATQANKLNGHQPEQLDQDEVRRKTAEAAQERQRLSAIREQVASKNQRQRSEDMQIEQEAWDDRAFATTISSTVNPAKRAMLSGAKEHIAPHDQKQQAEEMQNKQETRYDRALATIRNPTVKPARRTTLPGAAAAHPRTLAPAKPRSKTTKQPDTTVSRLAADAKKARERWRADELEVRNERTRATDDNASDAEAQREAEANHALIKPPPYVSIRNSTVHNTNDDDAKLQAFHDDGLILEPSTLDHADEGQSVHINPPEGPFPLNSAARIQAVKKTIPRAMVTPYDDVPTRPAAQRFMGSKEKTPFIKKKATKGNPDLLPITAHDLQLYKWRAEKLSWAETRQLWAELNNGAPNGEDTLRTRFRQVEKLIDTDEITTDMCQQVIDGDKNAGAELNRLVALNVPDSAGAGQSMPFRKITTKQEPVVRSAPGRLPPPAPPAPRPTESEKVFSHNAYVSLLENARSVYAAIEDDDEDDRGSPPAEEDCVRWEYFTQRRDLVSENLEDDYEMLDSETPWREYNAAFDQVGHANAEAMSFIFTVPAGAPEIFKADEYFVMIHKRPSEGMVDVDLKTDHGMVQVRVSRRMLTFQDHLMPESKQNWLPKTSYCIQVRRKKKAVDDMFEEAEIELYTVDDAVYTSLDHANSRAMEEWVRLTYTIRSINLNERQCKLEEAKQDLLRAFEDEAGQAFVQSMDDDEKTVEVAVKALGTQGPRN